MTADDNLDQEHWTVARQRVGEWVWCPHVWSVMCNDPCEFDKQHDRDCPCGSRYPLTIDAPDKQIRSAAVHAAASWLAGVDPYPQCRQAILDTADVFARWIQTGQA